MNTKHRLLGVRYFLLTLSGLNRVLGGLNRFKPFVRKKQVLSGRNPTLVEMASGGGGSDPLFTVDVVRDFIISEGGKVSNTTLVTHFRTFLNDPVRKVANRQQFKEYVNTLATVKLDTSGEKLLVLKKKFRDSPSSAVSTTSENKSNAKDVKKEVSIAKTGSTDNLSVTLSNASSVDPPSSSVDDVTLQEESATDVSLVENSDELSAAPEMINVKVDEGELDRGSAPVGDVEMTAEKEEETETSNEASSNPVNETMIRSESNLSEISESASSMQSRSADTESVDTVMSDVTSVGDVTPLADDVTSISSAGGTGIADDSVDSPSTNVKERARKLNESDQLIRHNVPGALAAPKPKRERESRRANMEDSDVDFSLSEVEKEWMLLAIKSDYHPMAKMLQNNPSLATKKDFVTGCTALHWAAKNGKAEIVKMLCGTYSANPDVRSQGGYTPLHLAALHDHDDIIELLVRTYRADPNIRDYSGRKAKQHLPNSTSASIQQILQPPPKKVASSEGLQRSGSYSKKIAKAGHFGLNPGGVVKDSWTGGSGPSRSPSASPNQARRAPGPTMDDIGLMPPPKSLPAVVRRKPVAGNNGGVKSEQGGEGEGEGWHSDSEAQCGGEEGGKIRIHLSDTSINTGTEV